MRGWQSSHIEQLKDRGLTVAGSQLFTQDQCKNIPQKSAKNIPGQSEDAIQRQCFAWFAYRYPEYRKRIFHIPNGGQRNIIVAAKLKAQGTLAGVWDIFLSAPKAGYSGLFIEIKAGKNKLTDSQIQFRQANEGDYLFKVCYCLEDFMDEVNKYLK